jgi:hypothetical protein
LYYVINILYIVFVLEAIKDGHIVLRFKTLVDLYRQYLDNSDSEKETVETYDSPPYRYLTETIITLLEQGPYHLEIHRRG